MSGVDSCEATCVEGKDGLLLAVGQHRANVGESIGVQRRGGTPWMHGKVWGFVKAYRGVGHDIVAMMHRSHVIEHVLVDGSIPQTDNQTYHGFVTSPVTVWKGPRSRHE